MKKKALITGVTGQDGSYLAELLLEKGYRVFGLVRRSSSPNYDRIEHILDKIELIQGDLLDQNSLIEAIQCSQLDEVYNLGAQSFVPTSWNQPVLTGEFTALGVTRILEAIRVVNPKIKLYQASSSEMFGAVQEVPQNEKTPFYPKSPYGVAKVYGHYIAVNYRESYGMFVCSGILFNHESPRRGLEFVTRKVSHGVARIKLGFQKGLRMGNLDSQRDWGYAREYVEAMWLMLQQKEPDDYVIATGKAHTVRRLLQIAFSCAGLNWEDYVVIDEDLIRPAEVNHLLGDSSKAREMLGWSHKVSFEELIAMMVESDLKKLKDVHSANGEYKRREASYFGIR